MKKYTVIRPKSLTPREQTIALLFADKLLTNAQRLYRDERARARIKALCATRQIAAVYGARLIAQEWRE